MISHSTPKRNENKFLSALPESVPIGRVKASTDAWLKKLAKAPVINDVDDVSSNFHSAMKTQMQIHALENVLAKATAKSQEKKLKSID